MNNKILIAIIVLILVIGGSVYYFFFLEKEEEEKAGLPNPAAVYCEEQGGTLESRMVEAGQKGFCIFDDGSECGQWDFFRGDCQKGERFCKDLCGDGTCQEVVCLAIDCPCAETPETCPEDCK